MFCNEVYQRYSNKLALHHDASLVTGSIKLNEAYEGGSLNFPRQGVTNDNTPIGHCIYSTSHSWT